jgi:nucleotide-binding universal stress UspA family protein
LTIVVLAKRIRGRAIVFRNILVPTDGSELAVKAVEQSVLFAREAGAKITAVTVTEPYPLAAITASQPDPPLEYKKLAEAHAEKVLDAVSVAARQRASLARHFASNTRKSIRQSLMPLPPGGAI